MFTTNTQPSLLIAVIMLAYIDPGTGTLIWQAIISSIVGMFFYLKKTRVWVVGLFQKLFR
jgi:hypothetical protein